MIGYTEWSEKRKIHKRKVNKRWRDANREKERERGRIYAAKERATHPERVRERDKKWRAANPERVKEIVKKSQAKEYATNPERVKQRVRKAALKWLYGITVDEYTAMVIAQNNCCAVCGTNKPGGKCKRWHVDHCHETKTVRQLLCSSCNGGLGFFKHNTAILQRAIDYLKKFS